MAERATSGAFTVRCACGAVYHTEARHVGRQLRCRCGRTITVDAPAIGGPDRADPPRGTPSGQHRVVRRRRRRRTVVRRAADRLVAVLMAVLTPWRNWTSAGHRQPPATSPNGGRHTPTGGSWRTPPHGSRHTPGGAAAHAPRVIREVRPRRWSLARDWRDPRRAVRWITRASWGCLVLLAVTWVLLVTASERFLPLTMLAYGPRLVVLLPVLPLALGALVVRRQALLPLAAAAAIAVGPIMGGRVSLATLGRGLPAAPPPGAIRVLTFNARGGTALAFQLGDALRELQPDIALFQECDRILWDSLRTQPGLHVTRHRSLCTASRWPIGGTDTMPRLAFAQMAQLGAGGDGLVARHQLDTPGGPLYVVNLHLETARKGLRGFMGTDGFIPDGLEVPSSAESADEAAAREGRLARGERAKLNTMVREAESERAARWATGDDQSIPLIVAGDFNIPVESAIYRRHWSPYRNAFDETGTGLGWSKREGALLRIRIDHILVTRRSGLRPIGAVVGPDLGSDHLPILADIAWPGTR